MPESALAKQRLARAIQSLKGLNYGDAFGEHFFSHPEVAQSLISRRSAPSPPWRYTDDTIMAIAIVETLVEFAEIRARHLAENFGRRYIADPQRGYGAAKHQMLPELARTPSHWKEISEAPFNEAGSFGNGSAMRVAPLGAYFADDLDAVINQAVYSSSITHRSSRSRCGSGGSGISRCLGCRV